MGQKQKTEKKKKEEEERLNDGENNGQATHGARKHAWRTHGAHKLPGPIFIFQWLKHFANFMVEKKTFC